MAELTSFTQKISKKVVMDFRKAVDAEHDGDRYGNMALETENALKLHTKRLIKALKNK